MAFASSPFFILLYEKGPTEEFEEGGLRTSVRNLPFLLVHTIFLKKIAFQESKQLTFYTLSTTTTSATETAKRE